MTRLKRQWHSRWWWLLVLAMLLTQMLGMVHRVAHAKRSAPVLVERMLPADASGPTVVHDHRAAPASGWLQRLFGADGHGDACVLYDQLGHADGLAGVLPLWLPAVWVAAQPIWHARWYLAAQAAGFLARGPPQRG